MKEILDKIANYATKIFYKVCEHMDKQASAVGRAQIEAFEARNKSRRLPTCGHLSTTSPAELTDLLQNALETQFPQLYKK